MTSKITHRAMSPEELLADSNFATAIYQDGTLRTVYLFSNRWAAEDMAANAIKDREDWHDASSWTASVVTFVQDHGYSATADTDIDRIIDECMTDADRAYIDHIGNGGIVDEDPRDEELREYREFVDALNGWISRGMCDADEGGIYNEGTEMLQQVYGFLNGYAAASQHIDL